MKTAENKKENIVSGAILCIIQSTKRIVQYTKKLKFSWNNALQTTTQKTFKNLKLKKKTA